MSTNTTPPTTTESEHLAGLVDSNVVVWRFPGLDRDFVQKELTFFGKNQLIGVMLDAFNELKMQGIQFEEIASLLGMGDEEAAKLRAGTMDASMIPAFRSLIDLVLKAGSIAPRVIEDLFLVALNIPVAERFSIREHLQNIDDETGFGIIETFIEQNGKTIAGFLTRWKTLGSKLMQETPRKKSKKRSVES